MSSGLFAMIEDYPLRIGGHERVRIERRQMSERVLAIDLLLHCRECNQRFTAQIAHIQLASCAGDYDQISGLIRTICEEALAKSPCKNIRVVIAEALTTTLADRLVMPIHDFARELNHPLETIREVALEMGFINNSGLLELPPGHPMSVKGGQSDRGVGWPPLTDLPWLPQQNTVNEKELFVALNTWNNATWPSLHFANELASKHRALQQAINSFYGQATVPIHVNNPSVFRAGDKVRFTGTNQHIPPMTVTSVDQPTSTVWATQDRTRKNRATVSILIIAVVWFVITVLTTILTGSPV